MRKAIILLALIFLVSCCPIYVSYEVEEETIDRTPLIKEYLDSKNIGYCSVERKQLKDDHFFYQIKAREEFNVSDMMKAVKGDVVGFDVIQG